ncbi:hypothetical protein POM88_038995 [Heracleum sosnowskyi]|uniref:Transmembrane protein n=1 Tax=Heracleum sosnowskyi TaxID=360622 RepID=A0AAD8HBR9_9APIA|nr:hypothetical protein POM88_038995 [Heracleum sosnowskyi]
MATNENEDAEEDEEEKQVTEIPLVPQSLIIKSNPETHNHNFNHNLNPNYIFPCETSSSTSMINIFPPINHENLRPEPPDQSLPDQDPEVSGAELVVNESGDTWWDFGFSYLRCKVYSFVSSFRDHSSGALSVGAAAMVAALWYLRVRKQRRRRMIVHKESRDQLIRVIKEKDEKISTLLRQVAQMNEILLGLYTTKGRPTT